MGKTSKKILWIFGLLLIAALAFYGGKKSGYDTAYFEGAIFGDSSGYKRGYFVGFEDGFQLRDSIAQKEIKLRQSEQFNLNIIYEERGNPEEYITLEGEVKEKQVGGSFGKRVENFVKIKISSEASFARYKNISLNINFIGARSKLLKQVTYPVKDILYPGKTITFELAGSVLPRDVLEVEVRLESALGLD